MCVCVCGYSSGVWDLHPSAVLPSGLWRPCCSHVCGSGYARTHSLHTNVRHLIVNSPIYTLPHLYVAIFKVMSTFRRWASLCSCVHCWQSYVHQESPSRQHHGEILQVRRRKCLLLQRRVLNHPSSDLELSMPTTYLLSVLFLLSAVCHQEPL